MKNEMKKLILVSLISVLVFTGAGGQVWAADIVKSGNIEYRTQIENIGWQDWKGEDEQSGTYGKGLRLEGIEINITNLQDASYQVGVQYKTHVENVGWQDWVADGAMSGTEGQGLRLEAIQIELTGVDADKYDIYYRVHAQNVGWMGWAANGEEAGTAGYGYRLEAIQIQVKLKSESSPVDATKAAFIEYDPENDSDTNDEQGNDDWDTTGSDDYADGISN